VSHSGRPLSEAHRRHQIRGGQFMRRIQILRETWPSFDIPEPVRKHFIAHNLALQPRSPTTRWRLRSRPKPDESRKGDGAG
jgi:hypothetical protein